MHIPIKAELEVKEDSKSMRKLLDVVSTAIGFVGLPTQKYLENKVEDARIVSRAKAEIKADDLRHAAALRREYLEMRRIKNIQSIVQQTAALLEPNANDEPVNDDWATAFFDTAEDITDEKMQALWAKVLAGEVNKPGSFAPKTLRCLKDFTAADAQLFSRLACFTWKTSTGTPFIIVNDALKRHWDPEGDGTYLSIFTTSHLAYLKDLGVLGVSEAIYPRPSVIGQPFNYFGRTFIFEKPPGEEGLSNRGLIDELVMAETYFTRAGVQLSRLVEAHPVVGYPERSLKELGDELRLSYREHIPGMFPSPKS